MKLEGKDKLSYLKNILLFSGAFKVCLLPFFLSFVTLPFILLLESLLELNLVTRFNFWSTVNSCSFFKLSFLLPNKQKQNTKYFEQETFSGAEENFLFEQEEFLISSTQF